MIRYTEEEYRAMMEKRGKGGVGVGGTARPRLARNGIAESRNQSAPSPYRSKLEQAYAGYLHTLMLAGDIQLYRYEPIRLNLAPKTTLTPDFLVIMKDGMMEFHETKGWKREDAMVKLKVAAKQYPWWKFVLVQRKRGIWDQMELPAR